ncbi:two-component system OmpR family sensor kinase [Phycicoccus badiiscoriae]|uniref:histidine kinase n=1 Tax=Pedococcus badiiscoriae TaxID=642776 RepID=A0A852WKI0_9MICO|nr:HAMP domain-containing sensor histidine kinase [Pedococcus badiiscoriae]NYG07224.1 two-component system OmpR family sensor kinase [Pedococcus badiiscoriae]
MGTTASPAQAVHATIGPAPAKASPGERVRHRLEDLPLRIRLIAVMVLLLLLALTVTASATAALMRRDLMGRVDDDLQRAYPTVAQQALDALRAPARSRLPSGYAVVFYPTDGTTPVEIDPTGASDRPAVPASLAITDPRVDSPAAFTIRTKDGSGQWRAVAGRLRDNSATFIVAVPLASVSHTVRRLVLVEVLIGLVVLAACAVMGWYAVHRAFRPLRQIEDTAAAIADGDLARRIPTRTAKDEVTSLSRSLNVMLAQIEQSFAAREASEERMRQFVADASHELRTPLAAVRGYAELYRQGAVKEPEEVASAMTRIEGEATRMGGLVEDLLMLARLDDQRPLRFAPVDLTVLAADAAQDARAIDPTRPIAVTGLWGPLGPTVVPGDDGKLRQLVANLVSNALNHTPPGSPLEIAVGTRESDHQAVVEVRDHGPGVDPDKARKVFERFYRADPSRVRGTGGGNGLGLAIAAAIVNSHRGRIGVAQTAGGGATFIVELPTANSQAAPSTS